MESGRARARWIFGGVLLLGAADLAFLNLRLAPEYEAQVLAEERAQGTVGSNQGRAPPVPTSASPPAPPTTPTQVAQADPTSVQKPAVPDPAQTGSPSNTAPSPTTEPPATAQPTATEPPVAPAPPVTTAPPAPSPPTSAPEAVADIYFDFSKHDLNLAAKRQLDVVAGQLRTNSALRVHIRGHSDKLGRPSQNQALSNERANIVKHYLTVVGVSEDRITTEALGDTEPADPEDNPVAWAKNRRVQIVWR